MRLKFRDQPCSFATRTRDDDIVKKTLVCSYKGNNYTAERDSDGNLNIYCVGTGDPGDVQMVGTQDHGMPTSAQQVNARNANWWRNNRGAT